MTNAEQIARDIGFLIGQYERHEITASNLCRKVEDLTRASCEHCVAKDFGAIFCNADCSCDEGFRRWLTAEVDI